MKKSAFEEHVELCDLHGGALDHESFADPARGLVRETIDYVARIWERILDSASPPYRSRPLLISIVDSRFLNAAAGPGPRADHILLNSGLVERLVGTANAAFATRLFLPEVGDAEKERLLRTDRPATEFSIPVRLRQKGALWPNCETRREAAREIAHLHLVRPGWRDPA